MVQEFLASDCLEAFEKIVYQDADSENEETKQSGKFYYGNWPLCAKIFRDASKKNHAEYHNTIGK